MNRWSPASWYAPTKSGTRRRRANGTQMGPPPTSIRRSTRAPAVLDLGRWRRNGRPGLGCACGEPIAHDGFVLLSSVSRAWTTRSTISRRDPLSVAISVPTRGQTLASPGTAQGSGSALASSAGTLRRCLAGLVTDSPLPHLWADSDCAPRAPSDKSRRRSAHRVARPASTGRRWRHAR